MKPKRNVDITTADLLDWLRGRQWLAEAGFMPKAHAVLCDPPYFLGSISKRFGKPTSAPAKFGRDGAFQRQSRGFMGQTWDGFSDMYEYQAWVTEWASLLLSFVHPGAVMLCFGGTRTFHRLAAGLEDAGWIVGDVMMYVYGSGFPKSHDVSKAIDRAAGAERETVSIRAKLDSFGVANSIYGGGPDDQGRREITAPATPAAQRWNGYGTALKPAYEPIIVARAPFRTTYAQLAQQFGTGAINVDGGRIEAGGDSLGRLNKPGDNGWKNSSGGPNRATFDSVAAAGRWPSNLILGCSCEGDEHERACPVRLLDEQSGESAESAREIQHLSGADFFGNAHGALTTVTHADSGTASRFFYCAKSARWEREAGLDHRAPQTVNDGRDTPIDNPYQRGETPRKNIHPTVKPITLTDYLARLILPPELDTPRRLLVPFSGVASEMIGAVLAGWDTVIGIEQSAEYAAIGRQRLAWWAQFTDYEQAKRAYDADHAEHETRRKEAACGVQQLALGVQP